MLRQLNEINPWLLAVLVVGFAEVYSTGLMLLCRKLWGTDRLSLNNEVAGFKFAVIGVFYAVLLAFVVIAVWEDYRDTEKAIRDEAKAVVDLHHAASAIPEPAASALRAQAIVYLKQVRDAEWNAMEKGDISLEAEEELRRLRQLIFDANPSDGKEVAIYEHVLDLIALINDNRIERLDRADGTVPPVLWLVLIAGALITLGYPAFFGTSNLAAQVLMTAALAALVGLTVYVAILLDFPFTGELGIPPEPFDHALKQVQAR
jgi:hypothetical protein